MSGKVTPVLDIRELLRYVQAGQSDRAIHRALGLGRDTVAKYRRWAEQEGLLTDPLPPLAELQARLQSAFPPAVPSSSSVEPYRATVIALREQGLEVMALWQRLREQHGYTGQYASVWRFVQALEPARPEAVVRVEVTPGAEAQVDFGFAGAMFDPLQQRVHRAWVFVMTLSWSRHQYVEFVFDQRVPTWISLHQRAFEAFGGVPQRIVLDNLKAGISVAHWNDPGVQRVYRECAEYYGFLLAPCRPATPQHKGKVESGVHYVKRNFLAGRDFTNPQHHIQQANVEVRDWVREVAGQRVHGTTKQQPLGQFLTHERATLRLLPATPFETATWKQVKLHRDCYVVFEQAYYSAPCRYIGEPLWVRGTGHTVQIYREFELIATHSRATQPGQRTTVLAHLPPEKVAGLTLTPQTCQERAVQVGPQTAHVVAVLLAERPLDRLRAVHRLLLREDPARLERACARAVAYGEVTLRGLTNILKTGIADQPEAPQPEPVSDWPRFARPATDLVPTARS